MERIDVGAARLIGADPAAHHLHGDIGPGGEHPDTQ